MFFMQAAQAPVAVRIQDRVYYVPKMTMDELVAWGLDVVNERVQRITANMDDGRKREHLTFYPVVEPNLQEMSTLVRTVSGIKKVVTQCMSSADVQGFQVDKYGKVDRSKSVPRPTEQEVAEWVVSSGVGRLTALAWELADLRDVAQENPYPDAVEPIKESGDPLTTREKAGSKA